jgi:hypothetical protein
MEMFLRSRRRTASGRGTLVVLAVGLLAMPSLSPAAPKPPPQPLQDSVTGGGAATLFGSFTFDVRSGPSGENPTGQVRGGTVLGVIAGPVTCLAVRGNVATMNVQASGIARVTFQVTDNSAAGTADVIEIADGRLRAPSDCSPVDPNVALRASLDVGDIVVVDAQPLPTSTEQCKNGGYASFNFKNQGECVAFVQRGPNPQGQP